MHHDRIDAGLLHQHDVLREMLGNAALHGVTAVFDHDRFAVVAQNVGQGFDEDPGGRAPARHDAQIAILADFVLQRHPRDFQPIPPLIPYRPKPRPARQSDP